MSVIKQDVEEYNLKVIKSLYYATNYSLRIVNFSLVISSITVPDEVSVIRHSRAETLLYISVLATVKFTTQRFLDKKIFRIFSSHA